MIVFLRHQISLTTAIQIFPKTRLTELDALHRLNCKQESYGKVWVHKVYIYSLIVASEVLGDEPSSVSFTLTSKKKTQWLDAINKEMG